MHTIYPVILSGGAGSRLWPLSRSLFPKQFLALANENSLIQDTVMRAVGDGFEPPLVICNHEHRFLVAEQLRETGITPRAILLEPVGRNTAPAAAVAAALIAETDPDGLILLMPADHIVLNRTKFLEAVDTASKAALAGHLVTFGISPDRPETGYGYIERGASLNMHGIFAVSQFVEKPNADTAAGYLAAGNYSWNSGIFLFKAQALIQELERLEPQMLSQCRKALKEGKQDLDFFRLEQQAFSACTSISIDYAVMERTEKAAVVPVEMGWSDIGSWESLWAAGMKDDTGNRLEGDVLHHDVHNSYLRSEGPLVAAIGVEGLVIVATKDAVLVSSKHASQNVKNIVNQLEKLGRDQHLTHRQVYRPWGMYESIDQGGNFQVKHITVKPGARLSLQMHHKRAEHWIVVSGTAQVTCDDKVFTLKENQSTYIPLGARHRLENLNDKPLHLIEVQCGSYLGEDDIVRYEDSYGR